MCTPKEATWKLFGRLWLCRLWLLAFSLHSFFQESFHRSNFVVAFTLLGILIILCRFFSFYTLSNKEPI